MNARWTDFKRTLVRRKMLSRFFLEDADRKARLAHRARAGGYVIDSRGPLPEQETHEIGQDNFWSSQLRYKEAVTPYNLPIFGPTVDGITWEFVKPAPPFQVAYHAELALLFPGERHDAPNTLVTADINSVGSNEFVFTRGTDTENMLFILTPSHPYIPNNAAPEITRVLVPASLRFVLVSDGRTLLEFPITEVNTFRIWPYRIEAKLREQYGSTLVDQRIRVELRMRGFGHTKQDGNGNPLGHELANCCALGFVSGFGIQSMRKKP